MYTLMDGSIVLSGIGDVFCMMVRPTWMAIFVDKQALCSTEN